MKIKTTQRKTRKARIGSTNSTQIWAVGMPEPQWIQTGITQNQSQNQK